MLEWDFTQDLPMPLELLHVLVTTPPTLHGPIVASNLARRLVSAKVETSERSNYAIALRRRAVHLREKGGACTADIAFHLEWAAECFEKTAPSETAAAPADSFAQGQTSTPSGVAVLQYPSEPVPHAVGKGFTPPDGPDEEQVSWQANRPHYSPG